jgi:SAM-dependent methyltransferase
LFSRREISRKEAVRRDLHQHRAGRPGQHRTAQRLGRRGGRLLAAHADHFERALTAYHPRLFETAAITTRDRVLDIGCGTGRTTRDAARIASAGSALGVDLSSAMLDVARRRIAAEGLTNVTFEQVDGPDSRVRPGELRRGGSAPPAPCSSATAWPR